MKFILPVVCLFPVLVQAQDCRISRETDPYTRETKLSSGFISLPNGSVSIDADSKEIDFFFVVPDKCFNDASTVYIFFEGNKTRTTYRNAGSMNCDGYFHFTFRNSRTTTGVMQKLSSQKITQVIFTGTDKKETIISFLPDHQKVFMEAAACVVEEAKTLIR